MGGNTGNANRGHRDGVATDQSDKTGLSRRQVLQAAAGIGFASVVGVHSTETARANSIFFDGFEDGNLDQWTVFHDELQVYGDSVYEGSYSAGIETDSTELFLAEITPDSLEGGYRPDSIAYWWYDRAASCGNGGGVSIHDSAGDEILGLASDNPEWAIKDADGTYRIESGSYGTWTRFEVTFNWDDGTYEFHGIDEEETELTQTGDLIKGTNVESLALRPGGTSFENSGWADSAVACFRWDNLTVTDDSAAPAKFAVDITETNAPVEAGETLEVTATVENTGDESDMQTVTLEINGQEVAVDTLTLGGGQSQELTLDWETTDRNGVGVRVASEDDTDNSHVTLTSAVEEEGQTVLEIIDANTPVSEGDTLQVDVEITNTGDTELTQDIDFDVDAQREETREVTLTAGSSTVETFTWTVDSRTSVGLRAAGADDWDNSFVLLADTDFTPTGL